MTHSSLSQYETNSRKPDYKLLKKLSDLFNV
ncbi:helix-turn-helix domain-containing protein [Alkalihalobacillus pseudalcaliphilus]